MEFAVTLSNVLVDNGFDFVDPFKNICGCIGNTWGVAGHRIVVKHGLKRDNPSDSAFSVLSESAKFYDLIQSDS